MKFTNELKEFFRWTYGCTGNMNRAADWLYNKFVDEAWLGTKNYGIGSENAENNYIEWKDNWTPLFKSKEYKCIMDAAKWFDQRYDGEAEKELTQALLKRGVKL